MDLPRAGWEEDPGRCGGIWGRLWNPSKLLDVAQKGRLFVPCWDVEVLCETFACSPASVRRHERYRLSSILITEETFLFL